MTFTPVENDSKSFCWQWKKLEVIVIRSLLQLRHVESSSHDDRVRQKHCYVLTPLCCENVAVFLLHLANIGGHVLLGRWQIPQHRKTKSSWR